MPAEAAAQVFHAIISADDPQQTVAFWSISALLESSVHFDDLSPYTYCLPKNPPNGADLGVLKNALNIGWLENGCPYPKGATPWRFRWKLRRLARNLKHQMEGRHDCDICDARPFRHFGNGEIHVTGLDGTMYVAPELIVHYISKHKYLPPKEFVDAVLSTG